MASPAMTAGSATEVTVPVTVAVLEAVPSEMV